MDKLKMQSENLVNEHIEKIAQLFPNCITEAKDENGKLTKLVNFDLLKQELNAEVDDSYDKYVINWPDKHNAVLLANSPTTKTLRLLRNESVNCDSTKNLYIEGDNLDVLKVIRETYLGKIKLIYIDPPYNTGNNYIYKNDFSISVDDYLDKSNQYDDQSNRMFLNSETNGRFHTDWLNMIYPRLKISRDLLRDDGIIAISIDQSELANVIRVCDEIFGESNRINIVTVVHKPEGRNQEKFFGTSNEFAVFYAKDKEKADFRNVILDKEVADKYKESDDKGNYRLQNFIRMTDGKLAYREVRPKFWYPIFVNLEHQVISTIRDKVPEPIIEVYPKTKQGVEMSWKLLSPSAEQLIKEGELVIYKDKDGFISLMEKLRETQVIKTHWIRKEYNAIQYGSKIVNDLLGGKFFDFPKSVFLIEDILKLCLDKNDIVLDYFSGSGTTAHAIFLLNSEDQGNRQFILVQALEKIDPESETYKAGYRSICEVGEERIRRAGKKIKEENPSLTKLDIGFRVLKLDSSCMKDVYYKPSAMSQDLLVELEDNIKEDRTPEDLLFQVMLDMGVMLSSDIKTLDIKGKKVFNVNDGNLVCCFDKNLTDDVVTEIAKMKPLYAVFRDSSMSTDSVAVNFDQIFETYSPSTTRKVL